LFRSKNKSGTEIPDSSRLESETRKKIQEWIKERDMALETSKSNNKQNALRENWKKCNGRSIIQLTNFILDQEEHYSYWLASELEDDRIFGNKHVPKY